MSAAPLRLMAILAHPDDEALGLGGVLARSHAEGVRTCVVTATRGQSGRYKGIRPGTEGHPGTDALARVREVELRAAIAALGVDELVLLDHMDGKLDQVAPSEILPHLVRELRRFRPQVVLTFGPDGAYGHPDHIAISQFTATATVCAADAGFALAGADASYATHAIDKLYYMAWEMKSKAAFEKAFRRYAATVDGQERTPIGWPAWQITTNIDTSAHWQAAWAAVKAHASQVSEFGDLGALSPEDHQLMWNKQSFYRVMSRVNGGRTHETDLFAGLRSAQEAR